ncbi:MAG: transcription antitermination factor NusB [Candidatus Zixiibacteriota bacterium]
MADTTPRRRARELVLQGLYACEVQELDQSTVLDRVVTDDKLAARHQKFAQSLFLLTCRDKQWADEQIQALAKNWAIDRIADLDRNILRMALVELKEMPDSPVKVVLNEAIELAKKFSTSESSSFINGILDSFVKGMEKTPHSK